MTKRKRGSEMTQEETVKCTTNDGVETYIDKDDIELFNARAWFCNKFGYIHARIGGKETKLHRLIMGLPMGKYVDHIDGNKLNNSKSNLRVCTFTQNTWNRKPLAGKSKYKGVYLDQNRWIANITANGKRHKLGGYNTQEEAAIAYDKAAKIYHGEFAWLNFPPNGISRRGSKKEGDK